MGSESIYERGNTVKASITFKNNAGTATDPSGGTNSPAGVYIDVIKPDSTYLVENDNAIRDATGEYYYYFETANTDPLGIYVIVWKGMHNLGGTFGYKNIVQRKAINIVYEQD